MSRLTESPEEVLDPVGRIEETVKKEDFSLITTSRVGVPSCFALER
jgi:hypothetical protein